MRHVLRNLLLSLIIAVAGANYAQANVCFLPEGWCPNKYYKDPGDSDKNCPTGYSLSVTSCEGDFTLETVSSIDGTCGKCSCFLSCKDGKVADPADCTCKERGHVCPSGTSENCVEDACYECKLEKTLSSGKKCYVNEKKTPECPIGYSLTKPKDRCLLEVKQTCGDATCYKVKTCDSGWHLDDNCNCVKDEPVVTECPQETSETPSNKCAQEKTFGTLKCYQDKTCSGSYVLNEDTCECDCPDDLIEVNGMEECVDCDEEGVNPCTEKGYKMCLEKDFLIPEGPVVCICGDKEYYERCSTLEKCYIDQEAVFGTIEGCHQEVSSNNTSKYYDEKNKAYVNKGRYFVKNKCQKVDLSWIIHTAECDVEKDCAGHAGPAYGKIEKSQCVGGVGSDETSCSGVGYVSKCQCEFQKNATISAHDGKCAYLESKSFSDTGYYKVDGYDCSAGGETYVAAAICTTKKDCAGHVGPAYGKIKQSQCIGNVGVGSLTCGGETYVDSCQCPYKKGEAINAGGGMCFYYDADNSLLSSGYYKVDGFACTAGGETGVAVASCTVKKDCAGHAGPAYGLKNCKASGLYPADDKPVVCGGNVYAEKCKDSCSYDDTEATCKAKGKSFVSYCVAHTDKGDVAHGDCAD